jgi:hypothetical protein
MRRRNFIALAIVGPSVLDYIYEAAQTYNVSYDWLRRTASCETGGTLDPSITSRNKLYHGLYQFSWRTWNWMSAQAGWEGYSPYDPQAAAHVTAWAFKNGYRSHWPRCSYA